LDFPAEDPGFIAVVYNPWCPPKQSDVFTVELRRPEIPEIKRYKTIYDDKGNETGSEESETIDYGKQGMLKIKTKDVADGGFVNVTISCATTGFSTVRAAEVKDNEAELPFTAAMSRQTLERLGDGDDLVYKFAVETADKRAKADGGEIKAVFTHIQEYTPAANTEQYNNEFTLESADGEYKQTHDILSEGVLKDGIGILAFTDVLPGKTYSLTYHNRETEETLLRFSEVPFSKLNLKAEDDR
ncbi:MAG: hypothetical protein FWC64_13585, partial [Treponema sp.]|nr:hypothetical protein [Treponema sp.]